MSLSDPIIFKDFPDTEAVAEDFSGMRHAFYD